MDIKIINQKTAIEFLLPKHYSGRKPNISIAFGLFENEELKAVCTFGKPASNTLCDGICGKEHSKNVYELNRLCRVDNLKIQLSQFVSKCLKEISKNDWIVVSYSDTGMNHNGYIYQACNFIYTGATKERLEFHVENGHSRHGNKDSGFRKIRTAKHRYLYFCSNRKNLKATWKKCLNYKICDYPKGENKNYALGEFYVPTVISYTYC